MSLTELLNRNTIHELPEIAELFVCIRGSSPLLAAFKNHGPFTNHQTRSYSLLSAVVGSNPAARRAGSQEAMTAMNMKRIDTKIPALRQECHVYRLLTHRWSRTPSGAPCL
ncbi:MAG: hypothetical protein ABR568_16985 [Pyrinomonadaceae bacterium]